MVIWPEFRIREYIDHDHLDDAVHFIWVFFGHGWLQVKLSYVYAINEELFPNDLNAKALGSDIYEFSIEKTKLNVVPGEFFSLRFSSQHFKNQFQFLIDEAT